MKATKAVLEAIEQAERNGLIEQLMVRSVPDWNRRMIVPAPPTANNLFPTGKGNRRFMSKEYKAWLEIAVPLFRAMTKPPSFPVEICIVIVPGNGWRVSSDIANREKGITDALVKAGVLPDDNQKYVASVRIGVAKPVPGNYSFIVFWLAPPTEWWNI